MPSSADRSGRDLPFEARLRRGAAGRAGAATDPELARILNHVGRRRLRRAPDRARSLDPPAVTPSTGAGQGAAVGGPDPSVAPTPPLPHGPAGQLLEVADVGPSIRILRLGRPSGLDFAPGQYLKVGLTGVRRGSFTIASSPHDPHLELCIERIAGGRLTPRLLAAAVGTTLDLDERPRGGFLLDAKASVHLMVATGTGIAPFRSMVRSALHRGTVDRFVVLHGASHHDDLPYLGELTALAQHHPNLTYVPTVSRPDDPRNRAWTGRTGRVDALVDEEVGRLEGAGPRAYACGNGGMVGTVTRALRARGLEVSSETFD